MITKAKNLAIQDASSVYKLFLNVKSRVDKAFIIFFEMATMTCILSASFRLLFLGHF
jgi:hypothetical protein